MYFNFDKILRNAGLAGSSFSKIKPARPAAFKHQARGGSAGLAGLAGLRVQNLETNLDIRYLNKKMIINRLIITVLKMNLQTIYLLF